MIVKISAAAFVAILVIVAFQAVRAPAQDPRAPRDIILDYHRAAGHGGPVERLSLNGCQLNLVRAGTNRNKHGRKVSTRMVLRADLRLFDFAAPRHRDGSLSFPARAGDARIEVMNRRIAEAAQAEGVADFVTATPGDLNDLVAGHWLDPRIDAPDAVLSPEALAARQRLLALGRRLEGEPAPMNLWVQEGWIHDERVTGGRTLILSVASWPELFVLAEHGAPQEALGQAFAEYAKTCAD